MILRILSTLLVAVYRMIRATSKGELGSCSNHCCQRVKYNCPNKCCGKFEIKNGGKF
uniref:FeoB-associated Cys-rich membrane protein n=1 Tax=Arundo donax TaxID=35708 RepID=A0A0A9CAY7_ARUDO